MDFDFSDEQEMLRDSVRKWVDKAYDLERRRAIVKAGGYSADAWREIAELGLTGLQVPEANGGLGFGPVEAMEAGWQGDQAGGTVVAPLAGTYFNMRKTTIYGGSNEVQRNIVAQTVLG